VDLAFAVTARGSVSTGAESAKVRPHGYSLGAPPEPGARYLNTNELREALLTLARNHRWTWSLETRAVFAKLPGYATTVHPAAQVGALDDSALGDLLSDDDLAGQITTQIREIDHDSIASPQIAYFSPEFGISELVPQYSGGLGILAGDHLKAASDLSLPLCGVGLFYREGFFRQSLVDGRQGERYECYEAADLGCVDTGVTVMVPIDARDVEARVWRLDVGRTPLVVLDTDLPHNDASDRAITDRLYSGDRRHRLEQEMVLGVGGMRALAALGWNPPVSHLNEGHAGFLLLELIDRHVATGLSFLEALAAIRPGLVFTTHTPVPAGIDRFDHELMRPYLARWARRWGVAVDDLLALGDDPADEPRKFSMASLCLRAAGRANGVSKLHGAVSRELFADVPGGDTIGSVTNGVHARTWVAPTLQVTFDDALGESWPTGDAPVWKGVDAIDDATIRSIRRSASLDLQSVIADRSGVTIDPDALIIGFARRFATYKRATLLFHDPSELADVLGDDGRPIQFVFAGKAHPADADGKALLADVVAFAESPRSRGRFVFVPDYDMAVGRAMSAGCDVWLNNPIRPHEASGTSGEKAALNGGLNVSISDGWWDEMADGTNGWTIPASDSTDHVERDDEEAAAMLALLRNEVVPEYYADGAPLSAAWIERIRNNWRTLGPQVTAARMVSDYRSRIYEPALRDTRRH